MALKKILTDYFLKQSVRAAAWHHEVSIKDSKIRDSRIRDSRIEIATSHLLLLQ